MKIFCAALASTAFLYLSNAQEATFSVHETALQTDISGLAPTDLVNVIMKKKIGVSTTYPQSLRVTMEIQGGEIVAGTMTKQDYESMANDEFSSFAVELDQKAVGAGYAEHANVRRELADFIPYGIPMVLQDMDFWSELGDPSGSIKVCVADTGYDSKHVDLPVGYVTGTSNRWYTDDEWYVDRHGHGTHCSGTVAAVGGNDIGVTSILPDDAGGNFELVISNALSGDGPGSYSGIMKAVENCIDDGAKVISLSIQSTGYSFIYEQYFEALYEDDDILFVSVAGNFGSSVYSYPGSFPSCMSVAAIDSNKNRASFSCFNDQVEISAPGVRVWSTIPNNKYVAWDGTSMACPHVAAIAGLLWMHFPDCKNYQIRNVLLATAEDLGKTNCDAFYGHGLVQAKAAYDKLSEGNCGGDLGVIDSNAGGCNQLFK